MKTFTPALTKVMSKVMTSTLRQVDDAPPTPGMFKGYSNIQAMTFLSISERKETKGASSITSVASTNFSSTLYNPVTISGLTTRLDASDSSTITQVGSAVSQWRDTSGNSYHASQNTGASQPSFGTRTLNGLSTIDFDGVNDFFSMSTNLFSLQNGPFTMFMVAATDTPTVNQRVYSGRGAGTQRLNMDFNNTNYQGQQNTAVSTVSTTVDTSAHILGHYKTGGTFRMLVDGVFGNSVSSSDYMGTSALNLGTTFASNGSWFDGRVAEILIYNRDLTTAEINQIGNYLSSKWATAAWTVIP